MLDVFLTNKIASTLPNWTDELVIIANILNKFDGVLYSPQDIKDEFNGISNRLPGARDESDYRDEYGAYSSFLGIMYFERIPDGWVCRMNKFAKRYLCGILPDPQAYVRRQLSLFQYPNPIGVKYNASGSFGLEPNSKRKRYVQVKEKININPFRAILSILISLLDEHGSSQSYLTIQEIAINVFANPLLTNTKIGRNGIIDDILESRNTVLSSASTSTYSQNAVRNLHIIAHTGLIQKENNVYRLHPDVLDTKSRAYHLANSITQMISVFDTPHESSLESEVDTWVRSATLNGSWSNYYNQTLIIDDMVIDSEDNSEYFSQSNQEVKLDLPIKILSEEQNTRKEILSGTSATNKEITDALREKANIHHRNIVRIISSRLKASGIEPMSNMYIDICCLGEAPLLFEVKSCNNTNILSQVRKAVSQLYEYRYRHQKLLNAKLIIALETKPIGEKEWLIDYLFNDRDILLCWLEGDENLVCTTDSYDILKEIISYQV